MIFSFCIYGVVLIGTAFWACEFRNYVKYQSYYSNNYCNFPSNPSKNNSDSPTEKECYANTCAVIDNGCDFTHYKHKNEYSDNQSKKNNYCVHLIHHLSFVWISEWIKMILQKLSYCPFWIWILCSNQVDWFRSSVIGFQRFLQNKFFGKKSCGKVDLTSFEIFIELYNIVKTYDFAHSFIYTVQSFAVFQIIININHLP